MQPVSPPYTSFNRWFLIPFAIWVVVGGIAQVMYDRQALFAIVNTNHTPLLDASMVWITQLGEGVFATFVLLLLMAKKPFQNWWYFSAALLCNALPPLLVQVLKSSVDAPRPLNYFQEASWIHTLPEWDRLMERSFPSGHTAAAFCLFTFLSFFLTPRYKWFGFVFLILALLVAYSRIYLAAHFFHDVYVGSLLGVFFTMLTLTYMRSYPQYFLRHRKTSKTVVS